MKASQLFALMLIAVQIVWVAATRAEEQSCSAVTTDPTTALLFLQKQEDARRSACATSAIKYLGNVRYGNAVQVLISYLDFVDPPTVTQPGRVSVVRPDYPAVTALFQIGRLASPDLLSAIQNGKSATLRQNAAKTYLFVYRDDLASGIQAAKREEQIASTPESRNRLSETVQMLTKACAGRSEQEAQSCKDVEDME